MTAPRKIGVLGGMGPEATILFMQMLVRCTQANDDSGHVPLIVDNNTQVPSRIDAIINGTGADPAPVLAAMARDLETAGATALVMPCNTAHHYTAAVRGAVQIPFLSALEETANAVRNLCGNGARVGILGSPALRLTGVFDKALADIGAEVMFPEDDAPMLASIRCIKKQGPTEADRNTLGQTAMELKSRGADVLLVACSEFSLIAQTVRQSGVETLDTMDVLARTARDFAFKRLA